MRLSLLGCILSIMIAQAYAAAPEEDMKRLLEQNKPSEAYQMGKANQELIGQAAFDFYFGIASIDSGAPGEGALALERYLLQFPENRSARFHLARAYYVLGEDQLARMGFTEIIDGADEQDLIAINKYLDAIRARESRYLPTATFYAEVGVGHDSNINGGVRSGQVNGLPLGIVIANGSTGEQESDWFSTVTVGGQGALPIAPGISLYGGAKLGGRWNGASDNNIYDQRSGNLIGGISFLTGRNMFRLGGDYSHISIDKQSYLQVASLVGDWAHQLNQFDRFVVSLQWAKLSYEDIDIYLDKAQTIKVRSTADVRDSNLYMLNSSWVRSFSHSWNPVFTVNLNVGKEDNENSIRDDLSRDIYSAGIALSVQPASKWSVQAALTYQRSKYDDAFSINTPSRSDHYAVAGLTAAYSIDRNWSLRGEYSYIDQHSNIGFYDYDRHVVGAKLRYDFK